MGRIISKITCMIILIITKMEMIMGKDMDMMKMVVIKIMILLMAFKRKIKTSILSINNSSIRMRDLNNKVRIS